MDESMELYEINQNDFDHHEADGIGELQPYPAESPTLNKRTNLNRAAGFFLKLKAKIKCFYYLHKNWR